MSEGSCATLPVPKPEPTVEIPAVVHSGPIPEFQELPRPEQEATVSATPPNPACGRRQHIRIASVPQGGHAVHHARPGIHHVNLSLAGYRNEYRELRVETTTLDLPNLKLQQVTPA